MHGVKLTNMFLDVVHKATDIDICHQGNIQMGQISGYVPSLKMK